MNPSDIGSVVSTGTSAVVNIATIKAVTDATKRGMGHATKHKSKKKRFDIW